MHYDETFQIAYNKSVLYIYQYLIEHCDDDMKKISILTTQKFCVSTLMEESIKMTGCRSI